MITYALLTYLFESPIDGLKSGLLEGMEEATRAVYDSYPVSLGLLAYAHVHAVVGTEIVSARVHIQLICNACRCNNKPVCAGLNLLTWMVVEDDVNYVLVAPRDLQLVLLVNWDDVPRPLEFAHAREIHQHHPRIDA